MERADWTVRSMLFHSLGANAKKTQSLSINLEQGADRGIFRMRSESWRDSARRLFSPPRRPAIQNNWKHLVALLNKLICLKPPEASRQAAP